MMKSCISMGNENKETESMMSELRKGEFWFVAAIGLLVVLKSVELILELATILK